MLNGQLSLTDAVSSRAFAQPSRHLAQAGILVLVLALAGCAGTSRQAPIVDLSQSPTGGGAAPAPGSTYVVKPGDNLYRIAHNNNVDVDSLKRWNNLSDPNQIAVGQVLKLSAATSAASAAPGASSVASAPQPVPATSSKPIEPVPLDGPTSSTPAKPGEDGSAPAPSGTAPATPTPAPATAVATPPRASDASVISWGWPASGAVTTPFSSNTKGIDIAGAAGDPVIAAADGKVMYSGNGVRGLGNLVIINHQSGFITAYAHNRALLVKTGQNVTRGAKIAEVGQTDTTTPKLHFEIRRQGTPVDPLQYLPAR